MTSSLTTKGSTRRWRTIRHAYVLALQEAGTMPCWRTATNTDPSPHCTHTIRPTDRWVLGHLIDRALGGTDQDLAGYECKPCSDHTGGKLAAKLRKLRHPNGNRRTPSRPW